MEQSPTIAETKCRHYSLQRRDDGIVSSTCLERTKSVAQWSSHWGSRIRIGTYANRSVTKIFLAEAPLFCRPVHLSVGLSAVFAEEQFCSFPFVWKHWENILIIPNEDSFEREGLFIQTIEILIHRDKSSYLLEWNLSFRNSTCCRTFSGKLNCYSLLSNYSFMSIEGFCSNIFNW